MPRELAACVERANLDPEVHVIALAGNGSGVLRRLRPGRLARRGTWRASRSPDAPPGSPLDPMVQARNHDPDGTWDPVTDFQMMSRNLRGFMSLFHSEKPVVCKVHGYCVAGGTDMALCSDLIVAEDRAKIGYPPARVWGVPTTRALGVPGRPGPRQAPAADRRLDRRHDRGRVGPRGRGGAGGASSTSASRRCSSGSRGCRSTSSSCTSCWSTRRSTRRACRRPRRSASSSTESRATRPRASTSQRRAAEAGFKEAVRERDEPFGDFGLQ